MKHLALAVTTTLSLGSTIAAADPAAIPMEPGATAAAAFDAQANARFDGQPAGPACNAACAQTVLARRTLRGGDTIELRRARTEYGAVYDLVVGAADRWLALPVYPYVVEDCGEEACRSVALRSWTATRTGRYLHVTMQFVDTIEHFGGGHRHWIEHHRHQLQVACEVANDHFCVER